MANTKKHRSKNSTENKRKGSKKISKSRFILSLVLLAAFAIYTLLENRTSEEHRDLKLELPMLSGSEKLINYTGFTVSYNSYAKIPYWVAYELENYETDGEYARTGKRFRPDNSLPYPQAEDNDYRNSGWARGHMAPAADFKWSDEAMSDTFYFTNCCPQNSSLNGGMWSTLEKKTRDYAVEYERVYVVTGPIIGHNKYGTIGEGEVVVPDAFFKALLVFDGREYQSIGFVMENCKQTGNMQSCAMSVNELEERVGFDFFTALDNSIEEKIEGGYKLSVWNL